MVASSHTNNHMNTTQNESNEEAKGSVIKTLAIIGFIAAVVIGVWLTVQIVKNLPSAFSSLATIADGLYGQNTVFTVTTEKNIVNAGESLRVSWTKMRADGSYTFSYRCVAGVSASIRDSSGKVMVVDCNKDLTLTSGKLVDGREVLDIIFTSGKQRFTDIPFTLSFIKKGDEDALYEKNVVVTVVNATIPEAGLPTTVVKPVTEKPTPAPKPITPKPTPTPKPQTVYYKTVPVQVVSYPASNPYGYTDLEITYLGVGEVTHSGTFIPRATLDNDVHSAIRFSVKNIGTKTSGLWYFKAELPTNTSKTFNSNSQLPLLPGERATMTVSFDDLGKKGTEDFTITVVSSGESKISNNSFDWSVKITD